MISLSLGCSAKNAVSWGVRIIGKPSPPSPPDPAKVAAAQEQVNSQTALQNAELNRINQYTPYGNSTYQIVGKNPDGTPQYSQSLTLSPQEQQLFNTTMQGQIGQGQTALGMQNQVANSYQNPLNTSGIPQVTGQISSQSTPDLIKQAQDAAYGTQAQYLDPQFEQGQRQLTAQLANQGITQGSSAYQTAMDNFARQKQAAYSNAQMQAVGAGNQEQNTLYGQAAMQAGLQNQASQQAMQQLFALRNQPLNEYNALMTGAQVQQPQFQAVPGANVANTPVADIYNQGYQNQISAYNAQQAANPLNSLFSLGGSLGSAAIFASDRRMKRDIMLVSYTPHGLPLYAFRYNEDPEQIYIGVMADEVAPVFPDAVSIGEDGFARVDYSKIV